MLPCTRLYIISLLSVLLLVSTSALTQNNTSWNLLSDSIGNARIVGIGEQGHGFESINSVKSDLVTFLRDEKGFHVTIFESSFTLSVIAYLEGDTGVRRLQKFIYPFWSTASARKSLSPFFAEEASIKTPLVLGFDMQEDCRFVQLSKYLIDKNIVSMAKDRLVAGDSILNYYIGRNVQRRSALTENELFLLQTYYDIVAVELRSKRLPAKTQSLLLRAIENRKWLAKYLTIQNTNSRMYFRDSLMADNIIWLREEIFKGEKIILWAADLHLSKGNRKEKAQWMGEWLSRNFRSEYFSISIQRNRSKVKEGTWNIEVPSPAAGFNAQIYLKTLDKIRSEEWRTPCEL